MRVGFHIPIRYGLSKVPEMARERGANTIQVFTRAPQNWRVNKLQQREVSAFREGMARHDIAPVFVHTQYVLNLATSERSLHDKSVRGLRLDLNRAGLLGAEYVVTHIGSARGRSREAALRRVARAIDAALADAAEDVTLLLENSSGAGDLLGDTPEELAEVISAATMPGRLGVCIDTTHAFAAGHQVTTAEGLEEFLGRLERCVGLTRLKLIHLNDSKTPFGSRTDRHWHIGKGEMGREGLARIVNHAKLREVPFIMETPEADVKHDRMNMRAFRRLVRGAP